MTEKLKIDMYKDTFESDELKLIFSIPTFEELSSMELIPEMSTLIKMSNVETGSQDHKYDVILLEHYANIKCEYMIRRIKKDVGSLCESRRLLRIELARELEEQIECIGDLEDEMNSVEELEKIDTVEYLKGKVVMLKESCDILSRDSSR